jgi:hypothetical protein
MTVLRALYLNGIYIFEMAFMAHKAVDAVKSAHPKGQQWQVSDDSV